jgi:hypothetical protein
VGMGMQYDVLHRARAVAQYFNLDPKIPAELSDEDLDQIFFLYELVCSHEVQSPERISEGTLLVERERLAAILNAFSAGDAMQLSLHSQANYPFLGETVHVDDVVLVISNVRMITRKSDIRRQLRWVLARSQSASRQRLSLPTRSSSPARTTIKLHGPHEGMPVVAVVRGPCGAAIGGPTVLPARHTVYTLRRQPIGNTHSKLCLIPDQAARCFARLAATSVAWNSPVPRELGARRGPFPRGSR